MEVELGDQDLRTLRRKAQAAILAALEALGGEAKRPAIIDKAIEIGGFTDAELRAPGPPTKLDQYPRRVEYELSWALTNLKRKGRVVNPRWSVWALPAAPDEPPVAAPVLASRLEELRAMPYREYLRTPEWKETRVAALARAEHHCQLNASHDGTLHVHHNNYEHLGQERMADLTVLCETCHERHHEADGRPRRGAPRASFPPPFVATTEAVPPPEAKRSLLSRLLSR